jgi:hypothetical protein
MRQFRWKFAHLVPDEEVRIRGLKDSMLKTTTKTALVVWIACQTAALARANEAADVQNRSIAAYAETVRPLLERFCLDCHGPKKQQADIRFDRLDPNMAAGPDGETWHDALNKLNLGEMPPDDATQPSVAEREVLVGWMTSELKRAIDARRSTGGRVVMRRLTRYEYGNTLRDLLGLDLDFAESLPAERNSPDGLKNNGASLQMSPQQLEMYVDIARSAIAKAIVTDERPKEFKYDKVTVSNAGGTLYPPNVGAATFPDYPMEGEFVLRVQASVEGRLSLRESSDEPDATFAERKATDGVTMRVDLGVRPSPKNLKTKDLGVVKVTAGADAPQTFEFRGRMENFPLHDPRTAYSERRFPGLHVGFWNMTYDQRAANVGTRNKGAKKNGQQPVADETNPRTGPILKIHSVSYEAPVFETWPPAYHTRILFPSPLAESDEREYARQVLERFMTRAFRRPVTAAEVERKLKVYDRLRPLHPSLAMTLRELLPEILVAHDFLYLAEPSDGNKQKQPLTDYELASRLSYFLWSTMPDDALFELAGRGVLHEPAVLSGQVRTMLQDDRSWRFVENFTDQWLKLSGLSRVAVNPDYYPDFDERLKDEMRLETQHFFAEILRKDLSALNLLDSDFTMLNRALAEHYGIAGPQDHAFVRVALKPEDHRGGLLGQGSILLSNSSGDDSHPIYRGVFIRDRLLGDTPASPPPDVPELKQDDPELASLPLRRQLEIHREKQSCNSCHQHIDPWGIPLENFDAVGRWRSDVLRAVGTAAPATFNNGVVTRKRQGPQFIGVPVDASATLANGQQLDGFEGLKSHLLGHEKDRFARALVSHLLAYSLGRSLELTDTETVDSLTTMFAKSGYQLDELIVAITNSDAFRIK